MKNKKQKSLIAKIETFQSHHRKVTLDVSELVTHVEGIFGAAPGSLVVHNSRACILVFSDDARAFAPEYRDRDGFKMVRVDLSRDVIMARCQDFFGKTTDDDPFRRVINTDLEGNTLVVTFSEYETQEVAIPEMAEDFVLLEAGSEVEK